MGVKGSTIINVPRTLFFSPSVTRITPMAKRTAAERLRAWRQDTNQRQGDVAGALGCSQQYLSKLEAGAVPTLLVAVLIEALTASWRHGSIRCAEWVT